MKLQAIISSVALAAALSFSGAALAQASLVIPIPDDQVQSFKDACEALKAQGTASLTTDDADAADDAVDPTTTASTTPSESAPADSSDPAAQDNWGELLAGLTVEQCEASGFYTAM